MLNILTYFDSQTFKMNGYNLFLVQLY